MKDINITRGSDQYYYLALADSITTNGYLADISYFGNKTVVTPQNGIVILIAIFKFFNVSNYNILNTITILNYVFLIFSLIPFIKLLDIANIKDENIKSLLILVYLSGYSTLIWLIIPINDGIYNAGIIFLTYVLYKNLVTSKTKKSQKAILKWTLISIFSMVLVHFSFRTLIFLFSFLITFFLIKRKNRNKSIFLLLNIIFLSIMSLMFPYFFIDISDMISLGNTFFLNIWENFNSINILTFKFLFGKGIDLPLQNVLLKATLNLLLISILAILLHSFYSGLRKKNYIIVFSAILVILTVFSVLSLPSLEIFLEASPRYMFATLPFFYILLAKNKWGRIFIYFLVIISLAHTYLLISIFVKSDVGTFDRKIPYTYYKYNKIDLPNDAILSSSHPRMTYVWFGGVSQDNLCDVSIKNKNRLWIFGDYIFHELKGQTFFECQEIKMVEKNYFGPIESKNYLGEYVFERTR